MVDLYRSFAEPLGHKTLFTWHRMIMKGRRDISDEERYRTDDEPMQVFSGAVYDPKIHFEAPPSAQVPASLGRLRQPRRVILPIWSSRTH